MSAPIQYLWRVGPTRGDGGQTHFTRSYQCQKWSKPPFSKPTKLGDPLFLNNKPTAEHGSRFGWKRGTAAVKG